MLKLTVQVLRVEVAVIFKVLLVVTSAKERYGEETEIDSA